MWHANKFRVSGQCTTVQGTSSHHDSSATIGWIRKEIIDEKMSLWLRCFWGTHVVWKSQKKSHQRCEWMELVLDFERTKVHWKCPKWVHFGEFLKTWNLLSNSVTRHITYRRTRIGGKCQFLTNSNATFCFQVIIKNCEVWRIKKMMRLFRAIFKHCACVYYPQTRDIRCQFVSKFRLLLLLLPHI